MTTRTVEDPAVRRPATRPRASLWALRALALVTAATALAQPVLAGIYLDGNVQAIRTHGTNGYLLWCLLFAQLIAALPYRARRGSGWPLLASTVLVLGTGMQIGFGHDGPLVAHVPLGVAILAVQLGLAGWLCTAAAGRPRIRRDRHDEEEQP